MPFNLSLIVITFELKIYSIGVLLQNWSTTTKDLQYYSRSRLLIQFLKIIRVMPKVLPDILSRMDEKYFFSEIRCLPEIVIFMKFMNFHSKFMKVYLEISVDLIKKCIKNTYLNFETCRLMCIINKFISAIFQWHFKAYLFAKKCMLSIGIHGYALTSRFIFRDIYPESHKSFLWILRQLRHTSVCMVQLLDWEFAQIYANWRQVLCDTMCVP